ncbi:uncharacterized protein LOC129221442 [Uloborus diversus]|uniref:uncharacterized protein LOC129221442 n=1 Tax=Uloborus diversus TaxID=327109 RepID=UPI00240904F2|nr:uncharacterized protein LOC129221442 [Uloborus diversus]
MRLTTRKSKRNTTRAQPNFAETSVDSFPDQSKSKKRRQQSKKGASKNAKVRLLQDDSDLYSKELDGHATKSGNKRTKKGSCSASKPQTKTTMPQLDSSYKPSPSFQDEYETIDVDTVEETSPFPAVSNYDLTDHSSPEFSNSLVTRKEENGKIKMIIKSDPQKKKKKKKSKHEPYPGNS